MSPSSFYLKRFIFYKINTGGFGHMPIPDTSNPCPPVAINQGWFIRNDGFLDLFLFYFSFDFVVCFVFVCFLCTLICFSNCFVISFSSRMVHSQIWFTPQCLFSSYVLFIFLLILICLAFNSYCLL